MSKLDNAQQLRIAVCIAKADECRKMAREATHPGHRIMMTHIAETWERIAADIEQWLVKHQ